MGYRVEIVSFVSFNFESAPGGIYKDVSVEKMVRLTFTLSLMHFARHGYDKKIILINTHVEDEDGHGAD